MTIFDEVPIKKLKCGLNV